MRVSFNFPKEQLHAFNAACKTTLSKVGNGSRKALTAACEEILNDSLKQVPVASGALASTAGYTLSRDAYDAWQAIIGYNLFGDAFNDRGESTARYALEVHENLSAKHLVGKAKFLEDPVRAYAMERYPRTISNYIQAEFR